MDAEEVAKKYLQQAQKLSNFIDQLSEKNYNKEELEALLKIIAQSYFELLINLSIYTPMLKQYSVTFFNVNQLPETNFQEPPFEKDFFNSHL